MKKSKLLLLPLVFSFCLTSCASGVRHNIKEYILELPYKSDFRILQLTDTHIGDKDNVKLHYDFMDLTIKEAKEQGLDLIVVTGDLFTLASKHTALEFFEFIDSYDVNWTVTFGNHDEQCFFSIDWLTGVLNEYTENSESKCVFKDIQDDDVHGNCNFAINLMNGNKVQEQLIFMDSNRYTFNVSDYIGYDYFKQNQIDWYKDLVTYTRAENNDEVVKSLMFYHIPLPEVNDAWDAAQKDPSLNLNNGVKGEKSCNPDHDLGFFKVIKELDSTTGMYFGHDHINNFIVKYQGIDFGYGIKATDRVYFDDTLLGGRVITLKDDHSVEYQDIYHTYEEVM